jgi:hypothetical protein
MGEVQESVLSFSFARIIPKAISDKIQNYLENKDNNGKNSDGKQRGGNGQGVGKYKNKLHEDGKGKQELNHNTDKNHPNWRMKEGELFYHHQKDCPKTSDGKSICRKFLIRGMCDKACSRAHLLSKEDAKKLTNLLHGAERAVRNRIFDLGQGFLISQANAALSFK